MGKKKKGRTVATHGDDPFFSTLIPVYQAAKIQRHVGAIILGNNIVDTP
jgi:hypothetical protein